MEEYMPEMENVKFHIPAFQWEQKLHGQEFSR